jgi:trans-2,3-dihydro-3-hydroxyanthranilate isomerase
MQFHGGEDPATGSAAGCAISYLVLRGSVASGQRIHLRQGIEITRPSDLFVSARAELSRELSDLLDHRETVTQSFWMEQARVTDVRVGGSTVLVAKGRLFLS